MLKTARLAALAVALIGLAACASQQQEPLDRHLSNGKPYSGVGFRGIETHYGVLVFKLLCDGPLHSAGVRRGDFITVVNGHSMKGIGDAPGAGPLVDLYHHVRSTFDQTIFVTIEREGELLFEGRPVEIKKFDRPQFNC